MAQKKITDLQLRSSITDELNLPSDDGIQSYRVTAAQLKAYILSAGGIVRSMITPAERVPIGTVTPFAGSTAPTGYLLTDGALVSRTTYADLFAVISTTYGVGDGSTTFALPNTSGLFIQSVGTQTVSSKSFVAAALGTKSRDSTALPVVSFVSGIESANHTHTNAGYYGGSGNNSDVEVGNASNSTRTSNPTSTQSANHTHTISSGGDTYTKPGSISMNHIIKF